MVVLGILLVIGIVSWILIWKEFKNAPMWDEEHGFYTKEEVKNEQEEYNEYIKSQDLLKEELWKEYTKLDETKKNK